MHACSQALLGLVTTTHDFVHLDRCSLFLWKQSGFRLVAFDHGGQGDHECVGPAEVPCGAQLIYEVIPK